MGSLGAGLSVQLFPPATWSVYDTSAPDQADYPGRRPVGSWGLHPDGAVHGLDVAGSGWRDRTTGELVDLSGRQLVLAYGSNADPAKLGTKAQLLGGDPVIAVRAAIFGWAAVWCSARRRDGSVVATLVPAAGRLEVHPVLALTDHQLDAVDRWEGNPDTYRRIDHAGPVLLESGSTADNLQVYLGTQQCRPALLVDGRPLLLADVSYRTVDLLVPR